MSASELGPAVDEILAGHWTHGRKPELWDGHTAARVAADIRRRLLGTSADVDGESVTAATADPRALGNA